jgi:hypothetical protein
MRYEQLLTLVTLAAFAASSTAAAVCIAVSWHRFTGTLSHVRSGTRARVLLALRAAPTMVAAIASAATILAFRRHEPAATMEIPGSILLAGASLGAGLAMIALWRAASRCWRTSRFLQAVESGATRVTIPGVRLPVWQLDTEFPLVALAGICRPRLLVARRVLEQLPEDELHVVVRHELAHARRRDNVARLLLTALPDILIFAGKPLGLERAWDAAAEDASDDLATADDGRARVLLASALVRVARMASGHVPPAVPLLAFHSGESVERRVRRLIDPVAARRDIAPFRAGLFSCAVLLGGWILFQTFDPLLLGVHDAIEWLVNARL